PRLSAAGVLREGFESNLTRGSLAQTNVTFARVSSSDMPSITRISRSKLGVDCACRDCTVDSMKRPSFNTGITTETRTRAPGAGGLSALLPSYIILSPLLDAFQHAPGLRAVTGGTDPKVMCWDLHLQFAKEDVRHAEVVVLVHMDDGFRGGG